MHVETFVYLCEYVRIIFLYVSFTALVLIALCLMNASRAVARRVVVSVRAEERK